LLVVFPYSGPNSKIIKIQGIFCELMADLKNVLCLPQSPQNMLLPPAYCLRILPLWTTVYLSGVVIIFLGKSNWSYLIVWKEVSIYMFEREKKILTQFSQYVWHLDITLSLLF
jgi:hypothetical protein